MKILILGSPFTCVAVDGVSVSGLKSTLPANKLTTFTIETPSHGSSEFSAVVDITSKTAIQIYYYHLNSIIFKPKKYSKIFFIIFAMCNKDME